MAISGIPGRHGNGDTGVKLSDHYYRASSFQSCFVHAKELMRWSGNMDIYYESLIKMMAFGMVGVLAFGFTEIQGQRKKYKMKKCRIR